jgi:hypothetical protein
VTRPRIALIHAVSVAVEPVRVALARGWPEAEAANLLDDSLSVDRERAGSLTPALASRIVALARYAHGLGARGILFTCSAFGPAIAEAAAALPIPVLRPNEAMFDAAIARGARIGMVATFAPALDTMLEEFRDEAARHGSPARLEAVVAAGAMDALRAGDEAAHNRLVAEAARGLAGCDVVMLAHFSTARAAAAVRDAIAAPVLAAPDAAVARLRAAVA